MFFPISGAHISPIYLATVGFIVGILGGFFGVGGSFIAGPALRLVGLDWNFAVGTDLAHIVGKSVVAARRHRSEEHTSELQSQSNLVCRLLLAKKNTTLAPYRTYPS